MEHKPRGYWTLGNIIKHAEECKKLSVFKKTYPSAYVIAQRNNWLEETLKYLERDYVEPGFYSKDKQNCITEARKHKTRTSFLNGASAAYNAAKKHGWFEECTKHMGECVKRQSAWTYEKCKKICDQYETIKDFYKDNKAAYKAIIKNKWQNELFAHFKKFRKPDGYWTLEKIIERAKQFETLNEFIIKERTLYSIAWKNKWIDELKKYLSTDRIRNLTLDDCQKEAKKYSCRVDFQKKSHIFYSKCHREGWLDIVCSHMIPIGHKYQRMVYAYEFPDKSVYIGLTFNERLRNWEHLINPKKRERSQVYKHVLETGMNPEYKKITDYIDVYEAVKKEKETLENYRNSGWKILNIAKTGSVGGVLNCYDFKECEKIVSKYETLNEFSKKEPSVYNIMRKNGWFEELSKHLKRVRFGNNYWTDERLIETSLKFETKKELYEAFPGAYSKILKNKLQKECFSHMIPYINKPA